MLLSLYHEKHQYAIKQVVNKFPASTWVVPFNNGSKKNSDYYSYMSQLHEDNIVEHFGSWCYIPMWQPLNYFLQFRIFGVGLGVWQSISI